jgi:hypothetical protein
MQHCNMLLQHATDTMQHAKQTACIKQHYNTLLQSATRSIATRNNARAACNSRHGTMAACSTEAAAAITEHQCVYGLRDARDTRTCTMHASCNNANGITSLQHAPCKIKHAACILSNAACNMQHHTVCIIATCTMPQQPQPPTACTRTVLRVVRNRQCTAGERRLLGNCDGARRCNQP